MAQKFVELYANTLITIPSSDDEDPKKTPRTIIRKTPSTEEIKLITISDDSDHETSPSSGSQDSNKQSPAASIVNAALKKLDLAQESTPQKHTVTARMRTSTGRPAPYTRKNNGPSTESKKQTSHPNIQKLFAKKDGIAIAIEGNIGIGKTTFLRKLRTMIKANITTIREPLEQWSNNNNVNLLKKAYDNPKKWAFIFQTVVLSNLLQNHIYKAKNKIMERSLTGAYEVFMRAHHENETLHHSESMVLQHWYEVAAVSHNIIPDLIIYLRGQPKLAMDRIRLRGRKEERNIKYKYIQQLHSLYDDWLLKRNKSTRVIIINPNQVPEEMLNDLDDQLMDW